MIFQPSSQRLRLAIGRPQPRVTLGERIDAAAAVLVAHSRMALHSLVLSIAVVVAAVTAIG